MGLQEKRAIKDAEEGWVKERLAELRELCGGEIPFEIDWASFDDDIKGMQWLEANGAHQVNVAMRQICRDDIGKQAVRDAVKRIVFRNVKTPQEKRVTFADGVLEVRGVYALGIAGTVREREIKDCLLEHL